MDIKKTRPMHRLGRVWSVQQFNIRHSNYLPFILIMLLEVSTDNKGFEFFHKVITMVCINFQGDGFGEIQAKDT